MQQQIETFVRDVVTAMGLDVQVTSEVLEDGSIRADVQGDDGEMLVRRKGEALDALQHLVNSVFRDKDGHGGRIVVDCLNYRRGKDAELRQMTRFMMEKAKTSGVGWAALAGGPVRVRPTGLTSPPTSKR